MINIILSTTLQSRTWWGFQSLSKMTTVSAACRLRPRPPALVLRRKMKYWEPSSLNFFSSAARSSDLVVPETRNLFLFFEFLFYYLIQFIIKWILRCIKDIKQSNQIHAVMQKHQVRRWRIIDFLTFRRNRECMKEMHITSKSVTP